MTEIKTDRFGNIIAEEPKEEIKSQPNWNEINNIKPVHFQRKEQILEEPEDTIDQKIDNLNDRRQKTNVRNMKIYKSIIIAAVIVLIASGLFLIFLNSHNIYSFLTALSACMKGTA